MKYKMLIVCSGCLLAVLFIIAIRHITEDTSLSKMQVISRVETLYGGVVDNTVKHDDDYFVTFSTAQATYEVTVNEENGRFSYLTLIYEQPTAAQDASEAPPITNSPIEQKPILLTEQQVLSIATAQFTGEVEDIDFENTADGGYYLVEIDTNEEEVTVQIHAITGKILSVSFDE